MIAFMERLKFLSILFQILMNFYGKGGGLKYCAQLEKET